MIMNKGWDPLVQLKSGGAKENCGNNIITFR